MGGCVTKNENCENGQFFASQVGGPKYGDTHVTTIFLADGTWHWHYIEDIGWGLNCGPPFHPVYTAEASHAHDIAVRDYLEEMLGPPNDACVTIPDGCDMCTDVRGDPFCACTTEKTALFDYTQPPQGKCVPGLTLQSQAGDSANLCVYVSVYGMVDECDRSTALATYMGAGLYTYEEGQLRMTLQADKCITAQADLETANRITLSGCSASNAAQKWNCLADGRIQLDGTTDVFLRSNSPGDFSHCSTTHTPDECKTENLLWGAFERPGCTFCDAVASGCTEVNEDCAGTWGCDSQCTASFTVTTAQIGYGAACPTEPTLVCPLDCPEISATLGVLTAPMQIEGDYITTPNEGVKGSSYTEPPTGGATFSVLASTSTTVELECEVLTPTQSDDSFFVWFDDAPFFLWMTDDHQSFEWTLVGSTFALSAGMHTLHIGLREDGAKMRALRISSGDAVFTREGGEGGEGGEGQTCPTLSPPANAQGSSPCTASTEADTCTFICATGFQATNSQGTRTCQGDGTWGGEDLTCEAVVCPELPLPTNAVDSISTGCLNGLEGGVCSYACEIGYSDNGYESRTCNEGEWTGQNLVCTAMACPLLPVPDGGVGPICTDKVQGDTCTYTCLDNFDPSEGGLEPRQCDDGEWVGPALTCTEAGNCPQLSAPVGAVAQTCTAKIAAETCTFTCDVGYEPATSTRTCQPDLSWDGDEFQCTPLACPALTSPANAVVAFASCTTKLHQDTCTFACNTGFSDNGFSSRTCEFGVWSGQDLVCAPQPCPDLSFPNNALDGSVACSGKVEPETCTFSCQTGFKTAGDATRTCEAGAWTGFTFVCTAEEYTYIASDWAACDAACGGGSQTRTLECVDVSGGDNEVVGVAECAHLHAVEIVQTCNAEPCVNYDWVPGAWGDCGAPCGGSEQTRAVTCEATEDGSTSASVSVAVELCTDNGAKPPTSQTCHTEPCVTNHWVLGEWDPCSAECDGGVQTRVVGCRDPKGNVVEDTECDEDTPDTEQDCNTHSCSTTSYTWVICNWDACTAQCGGAGTEGGLMAGVLHRSVYCENGDGASVPSAACAGDGAEPITSSIGCNPFACEDYNWMTTAWSECTDGLRTRTRHCHRPDGSNAGDEDCNPSIAPGLTDTLCNPGMCSTYADVHLESTINLATATAATAWPATIIVLAATLRVFLQLV